MSARSGTYGYRFAKTASSGTSAYVALTTSEGTTEMHGLIAGVEYSFQVQAEPTTNGPSTTEFVLHLGDYNGSWAYSTGSMGSTTLDAFQAVSVTRTIRADATGTRVRLAMRAPATTGEYIDTDEFRLYPTGHDNQHENHVDDNGTETMHG